MIRHVVPGKSHPTFPIPAVPGQPLVIGVRGGAPLLVTVRYTGSAKGASENVRVFDQLVTVGRGACVPPAGLKGTIHVTVRNAGQGPVPYLVTTKRLFQKPGFAPGFPGDFGAFGTVSN